jgi:ABC-2 type transport system permease protein
MTTREISESAIHVQGLEKSYKELEVLRGVEFDVARGSIFALLGSNGAGKTTAVKILSTLLKADAGTASVNGFDVATQAADVRGSISLTGQFAAVDEILTGRENLVLVARLRRLEDPGAIADDLLDRFSLTDAAARKASTYSGGMRRRLDIAMSLIGNPPVIFLDEPTTIMPIAFMLLFVYVFGGAIDSGSDSYVNYLLPGILLITIASGISYTAFRLFLDMKSGIFERFQSMPIARSSVLWAHVLTSLVANLVSVVIVVLVALLIGFRSGAGASAWLAVAGILILFTLLMTWIAVIPGLSATSADGASAFSYPLIFLPFISSAFVPTDTMPGPVRAFAEHQPVTSIVNAIRDLFDQQPVGSDIWVALAWCVGILVLAYGFAMTTYRRRIS